MILDHHEREEADLVTNGAELGCGFIPITLVSIGLIELIEQPDLLGHSADRF